MNKIYSAIGADNLLRLSTNLFENAPNNGTGGNLFRYRLPFNLKSVKNILMTIRLDANYNNANGTTRAVSARSLGTLQNYGLEIRGVPVPDKRIQCVQNFGATGGAVDYSEAFMESVVKMRHAVGAVNAGGIVNMTNYVLDTGTGVFGVELEPVPHYSNRAHTGIPIYTNECVWDSYHTTGLTANDKVDFYAFYDAVLCFDPAAGICFVDK
jgi:hypothetical protein